MEDAFKYRQTIAILAQQLIIFNHEYNLRKSKLIKFSPIDKELREAGSLYKFLLDLIDKKEYNAIELKKILDKISPIPEEQIKYMGFVEELTRKYPNGNVSDKIFLDIADKWNVLDYVIDDIIAAMGMQLESLTGG